MESDSDYWRKLSFCPFELYSTPNVGSFHLSPFNTFKTWTTFPSSRVSGVWNSRSQTLITTIPELLKWSRRSNSSDQWSTLTLDTNVMGLVFPPLIQPATLLDPVVLATSWVILREFRPFNSFFTTSSNQANVLPLELNFCTNISHPAFLWILQMC